MRRSACRLRLGAAASGFDDPAMVEGSEDERLGEFRRVRDELRSYLNSFAKLCSKEDGSE